jgi:iron complex transport system substrate-binding protein
MPVIRRRTSTAWLVCASLLVASACGDDGSDDADVDVEQRWSFPLDAGGELVLAERPERIVMFEDVAASMIDLGIRPIGIHYINGEDGNRLFEGVDLDGIATIGTACEQVNVEAVAALEPDLLVYMAYDEERFCLTVDQVAQLEEIAPVLAIEAVGDADGIRQRYVDLATSLGVDMGSPDLVAKRERFDAAAERLLAVVASRPEISVVPVAIAPDFAGVAEPAAFADLLELRDRFGVTFAGPFAADAPSTATYFQELSAETIADHRGDVIMIDSKNETDFDARRAAYPLWAELPEVQAEQFVTWFVPGSFSYSRDAEAMELLADAIERAQDLVP